MCIKKYHVTNNLINLHNAKLIEKSIAEFNQLEPSAPSKAQSDMFKQFMFKHKLYTTIRQVEQIQPEQPNTLFEIPLLAASSEQTNTTQPWWDFDTIINDTFQLIVYRSSEDTHNDTKVDFEINALPQKESAFKSYFSAYKGTKRGIRVFWTSDQKQIALEGEIVHSFDGESISGNGYVLSAEQYPKETFKLMLEFFPIDS
jgi:hypothetical protein